MADDRASRATYRLAAASASGPAVVAGVALARAEAIDPDSEFMGLAVCLGFPAVALLVTVPWLFWSAWTASAPRLPNRSGPE